MPNQALAPIERFKCEPQDREAIPTREGIVGAVLSLVVVGLAIYQARELDFAKVLGLLPTSPTFWALFAISYLIGPASDWLIFQRLWGVRASAFAALIRKLLYNKMLVDYLGEIYFHGWARHNLGFVAAPFGAVKDVAILSAVAGNLAILVFLGAAFPFVRLLPLYEHVTEIGFSLAFVIGTTLAIILLRNALFSLGSRALTMIFAIHLFRILTATAFTAILWHLVLPDVAIGWWLLLATVRLLIARLPFVPNKDVTFAGIAVFALGEVEISGLMALMAGLILAAHIIVALSFAFADLLWAVRSNDEPAHSQPNQCSQFVQQ